MPSSWTAGSNVGAPGSSTLDGPPERMIPEGAQAFTSSALRVGGWISQYTDASRTRRAMSCEY